MFQVFYGSSGVKAQSQSCFNGWLIILMKFFSIGTRVTDKEVLVDEYESPPPTQGCKFCIFGQPGCEPKKVKEPKTQEEGGKIGEKEIKEKRGERVR